MPRITGGLRITGGFSFGPTTGGATLPVLRFDPSYIGGLPLTLGNSNTTIVDEAPGNYTVIATNPIPMSGAYMFSLKMDFNIDANIPDMGGIVGLGTRSFNPDAAIGDDPNSFGFSDTGFAFYGGSNIESGFPTFNVDAVRYIDFAVLNGNYVWIRVNGGDWNNNPSSNLLDGTGGYEISTMTGFTELYPMVTVAGDMGPTQFDITPTAVYGVPSGVTFFNMYTPAPPASVDMTIATADLYYANTSNYSGGSVSGDTFTTDGTWNSRIEFINAPSLESAWTTLNGRTTFIASAVWNNTTGYVIVQDNGPGDMLFTPVGDSTATSPAPAGNYQFPVSLTVVP